VSLESDGDIMNKSRFSLLPAVAANFASSLRSGEALIALTLLSLGLWGGLYVAAYWLSELVLPR